MIQGDKIAVSLSLDVVVSESDDSSFLDIYLAVDINSWSYSYSPWLLLMTSVALPFQGLLSRAWHRSVRDGLIFSHAKPA